MRAYTRLSFSSSGLEWPVIERIFVDAGILDLAVAGTNYLSYHSVKLESDSASLPVLRTNLMAAGIEWLEDFEHEYSQDELRSFPLLRFGLTSQAEVRGGPAYGTKFDLSGACERCGTLARQISPLITDTSAIPSEWRFTLTLDREFLVSSEVADSFRSLTGVEFWEVYALDGTRSSWLQLISTTSMPPASRASKGLLQEDPCPKCMRDGWFHSAKEPVAFVYAKSAVAASLPDVRVTYERFGRSTLAQPQTDSHFAPPDLIVVSDVIDVLGDFIGDGVEFDPVRLV